MLFSENEEVVSLSKSLVLSFFLSTFVAPIDENNRFLPVRKFVKKLSVGCL